MIGHPPTRPCESPFALLPQWENDQLVEQVNTLREERAAAAEILGGDAFLDEACAAAGAAPGRRQTDELRAVISAALTKAERDTRRRREEAASKPSAMAALGTAVRFRNSVAGAVRGNGGSAAGAVAAGAGAGGAGSDVLPSPAGAVTLLDDRDWPGSEPSSGTGAAGQQTGGLRKGLL